ncbi:MAG TPA: Dabb family protein [Ktedonobacterales bacterium]|nr:Dabb family protein [Ktedonobacterales bacterium]
MIRHVVAVKLRNAVTEDERDRWMDSVRHLANEIPVVRNLTIGSDVLHLPRSYDVALVVDFESQEALLTYERHPAHVAVAAVSRSLADNMVSVDFEW